MKQPEETLFDYTVEQFADLQILRYRVPGFETLSLPRKKLVYYLTQAALEGRDILFDQNGKYNLQIRRLLESIVDDVNIWFNGLMGSGFIYGGRVEMLDEENPNEDIMQGIVRFHVYMAPPSPAQEIDFVQTYDASYVETALAG